VLLNIIQFLNKIDTPSINMAPPYFAELLIKKLSSMFIRKFPVNVKFLYESICRNLAKF